MLPLMAIPLVIYAIAALFISDVSPPGDGMATVTTYPFWDEVVAEFGLLSGQVFALTTGQLLVAFAALMFFLSVVRSASSKVYTLVGNMLSVVVLCFYIVGFLALTSAGTGVFFLLLVFAFLDTLAAIALSMITSRARIRGAVEA